MRRITISLLAVLSACGDDEAPVFPSDYADTYQEVRNCRYGSEHGGPRIRVLASPDAAETYLARSGPIPVGGVLLKEQYDNADVNCEDPVVEYTVMERLETGSSPGTLDWKWQRVNASFSVSNKGPEPQECINCHSNCGDTTVPFDSTCTDPPAQL